MLPVPIALGWRANRSLRTALDPGMTPSRARSAERGARNRAPVQLVASALTRNVVPRSALRAPRLVDFEVPLALPLADVLAELVPFLLLRVDQVGVDVLAERLAHDAVLLQLLHRLAEGGGERAHVAVLQVLLGQVVEVL